jgi:hypothetical protein
MTAKNANTTTTTDGEIADADLAKVAGGTDKTKKTPAPTIKIEIQGESVDVKHSRELDM